MSKKMHTSRFGMRCPNCGWSMKVYKTEQITHSFMSVYFECRNVEGCKATFAANVTISHLVTMPRIFIHLNSEIKASDSLLDARGMEYLKNAEVVHDDEAAALRKKAMPQLDFFFNDHEAVDKKALQDIEQAMLKRQANANIAT